MRSPLRLIVRGKPPRQLAISLDRPVLNGMMPSDRNTAIRRLAMPSDGGRRRGSRGDRR